MFGHTAEILNAADVTFAQNERHYTNRYYLVHAVKGKDVRHATVGQIQRETTS